MTRSLALSKHRFAVWLSSFQLTKQMRAWGLIQDKKASWIETGPRAVLPFNFQVVSSNPRSEPKTAILLEESLEKETFWHFEETTNLILVNTSWQWVDTELILDWLQVMSGAIGTDTLYNFIIVRGYLTRINYQSSEVYMSCNWKMHTSISVSVYWQVDPKRRVFKGSLSFDS